MQQGVGTVKGSLIMSRLFLFQHGIRGWFLLFFLALQMVFKQKFEAPRVNKRLVMAIFHGLITQDAYHNQFH